MTARKTNNTAEETADAPISGPAIPPGVEAQVNIKYNTRVDPNQATRERSDLAELAELAGDDLDTPPPDEISAFCYNWQNFSGYPLAIIRLPDPPERRLAGNSYARPCFNLERLGDTTFDPSNLIGTLQFVNNNSGGVFRVWLADYNGAPIPGARIERIAIGDPPRNANAPAAPLLQPAPAPLPAPAPVLPPQKSESERQLEAVKDKLFTTALERALNPQVATAPTAPQLPPDQQAMLYLLGNSGTDFIGQIFGKLTDLAQQTAGVTKEPTLKERALDAGMEIIKTNPVIVERVSSVVERIVARVFGSDPRFDAVGAPPALPPLPPGYVYAQPQQQPPAPVGFDPETAPPDAPEDEQIDPNSDGDIMDILDGLVTLLNSDKPLQLSDPLFVHLRQTFPLKFRLAVGMIASQPLDLIVDWIKENGGPLYVSLLDGPASGPFLRQRLSQLQLLIIEAKNNAQKQTPPAPSGATPSTPDPIAPTDSQSPGTE